MNEIWKTVPGFEGLYEASTMGNIRSLDRMTADGRSVKGRVLKPVKRPDGYMQITKYLGEGKHAIELVHRLVAKAFFGDIPEGYVVDHIDHNRQNNAIDNLRYLPKPINDSQGGKVQGKAIQQLDLDGNVVAEFPSIAEAHRTTKINHSSIVLTCQHKRKTAGGFKWQYA
jgi:hypothetical protein